MNYRHIYHAGNFADIIKHITLISILNKLKLKDKGFCILDAFAGTGLYDIIDERAAKTGEAIEGILKLEKFDQNLPLLVNDYLNLIKLYNREKINLYPGSPSIISNYLREQDRLIAIELHKEDYLELKNNFLEFKNVTTHNMDAYNAIKAFIPPIENRGLVFIDPPFEITDEFEKLIDISKLLKKRFLGGILCMWFPIKNKNNIKTFYNNFHLVGYKESLLIEFSLQNNRKLNSSSHLKTSEKLTNMGILIANVPWGLQEEMKEVLSFLKKNIFTNSNFVITELDN